MSKLYIIYKNKYPEEIGYCIIQKQNSKRLINIVRILSGRHFLDHFYEQYTVDNITSIGGKNN